MYSMTIFYPRFASPETSPTFLRMLVMKNLRSISWPLSLFTSSYSHLPPV
jgi:hypothetical protein